MLAISHRGAAGHEPENTLRSIRLAMSLGADWVEIDVRQAEGQIIVLHDDTLDRTTTGHGRLRDQSFRTLRSLDAGKHERIPLLAEVLQTIDARVGLNIEIKEPGLADAVAEMVADACRRNPGWQGRVLLSSFSIAETERLAALRGHSLLGILFTDDAPTALNRARRLQAFSLHPSRRQVTPQLVNDAHASNIKVFVYTANTLGDIDAMKRIDVDGVFSDFPDRVIAARGTA